MVELISSGALQVGIKGVRGLVGDAYAVRPGIFALDRGKFSDGYTSLKPREETQVVVAIADLPGNADVRKISAQLLVIDENPADTSKFGDKATVAVTRDKENPTTFHTSAEAPVRPRNVELKLEKGDVFWNFAGTLVKDAYDLPDFSEQVNTYLDRRPAGDTTLKFLVKSDTPGKVKIQIGAKELSRLQTQAWPNPLDETIRLDRNLQLDFGLREEIPLDVISAQAGEKAFFTAIRMDVGGALGPERLLGTIEEHGGHEFATISRDYALAQTFTLDTSIQCVGVTSVLQTDAQGELYVELQSDVQGSPGSGTPLAKSNLTLSADFKPWTFTAFEKPVALTAGTPYWVVYKGVTGRVRLGLQTTEVETYFERVVVNRGGQLWKNFGSAANSRTLSLARLVYLPETDNQSAAVQIGINEIIWQPVDLAQQAKTVSFKISEAGVRQAVIVIKSHARGTITVANVIQEY